MGLLLQKYILLRYIIFKTIFLTMFRKKNVHLLPLTRKSGQNKKNIFFFSYLPISLWQSSITFFKVTVAIVIIGFAGRQRWYGLINNTSNVLNPYWKVQCHFEDWTCYPAGTKPGTRTEPLSHIWKRYFGKKIWFFFLTPF